MSSKVAFYTLGCKLNFSETSTIGQQFIKNGFDVVNYDDQADVYVINTCTVTENADRECRQIVRRALRNNPNAFVIVTGCYAQLRPDEILKINGVDAVLGSNEKFNLFNYIKNFDKSHSNCAYVTPTEELTNFNSSFAVEGNERTRAFFKIQDGCDYKCSYCTIPLARGKSRSANPDDVIKELKELINSGFKEIVLTGVNVGDYSFNYEQNTGYINNDNLDLNKNEKNFDNVEFDFYLLLKKIFNEVKENYRLRISSIEPNLLNDEIIELAKKDERLCKHFHIPLQSGNDKILRLMQRRYTTEEYRNLIEKLNQQISNVGIGVDVIVGFPGETEEDFLVTYNFLKDLPISYLHVFTYSERPNTKAISLEGNVDHSIRKKRNNMLRILSEKKRMEFYSKMLGKELIALFEHENINGFMKGFTDNYVRVKTKFNSDLINKFVKVKIVEIDENICTAEIIN
ncbi:MAG: MiaB/RimO family radical SAM methylthiotransferase [Melioribacteraceae bacterium]|nr:MiaB/RimO family radical SAM methylthiotransferase [Melioribacteraceae bacterium]